VSGVSSYVMYGADQMFAYAADRTDAASNYILTLGSLSADLNPPTIEPEFPTGPSAPTPITVEAPEFQTIAWSAPGLPVAFDGTLTIDDLIPEPFEDEAPVLSFPAAPDTPTDVAPEAPTVTFVFDDPELSVSLPAAPALLSLNVVPFDGITMPTIDETIPELTAVEPTIREYTEGATYTSSLLSALQETLEDRITNGGTGLNPDVENAIWDRGRERENRQKADALLELDRMETLGFSLPPGVYVDARVKLETELNYNAANLSREIMIKQAELELTNVTRSLELSNQLEGTLINYTNSVEQRLFESCKFATQAGIEIYNAKVRAYAAYLDAFKMRVTVYEAKIRAQLALVEAYKAQIAAEEAKAQVNNALVQQYKVQVDAALSSIEVYKAQIAGIQTKAEIEKLKVAIFGEQVRAYTAKIGAYTAGVEAYRARIGAESTKQEAFKARVQAYGTQADAAVKVIEARLTEFRSRIEAKNQEWEGYRAQVQGEAARVNAIAQGNQSLATSYKAEVDGWSAYNEVLAKQWQATIEQAQRVAEIGVSAAKANAELYMTTRSLASDAAKVGATVSAQLGAAALNAINWSSSFNNSFQVSTSKSDNTSRSTATQHTTSESQGIGVQTNHNYSYRVS